MAAVYRSIFFSAVDRYASTLVFFVTTAVLSRLLTPAEFGIYAVVNALTAVIAAGFQEFGGANYLIQKHDLSKDSIRSAFTVTFVISAAVGVALYLLAAPVSFYFGQDGLKHGMVVSALSFLLAPFSGTVTALFRRKLEFGTLALCNLAGVIATSVVSIVLALLNFSYMAPIWGAFAGSVVQTVILVAIYRDMASLRPSLAESRDVISFGLYSSGISIINVFYSFAPQLFLARILDFTSVGLYSRAINITQVFDKLVIQVLNPVIMPAISARKMAGEDLRRVYLDSVQLLSVVQWPALLFVTVMARTIVLIWLGPNWLEIAPLVRVLCIANLALFAACLSYPVLVAAGGVRDALVSSFISLPPSLLVIFGASFFGVQAVAASALVTLPFQAAIALYFIGRRLNFGLWDLACAILKSGITTAVSIAGVSVCAALVEFGMIGAVLGLVLACFVAAICWLLGLAMTSHPLLPQLYQAANGLRVHAPRFRPSRSTS